MVVVVVCVVVVVEPTLTLSAVSPVPRVPPWKVPLRTTILLQPLQTVNQGTPSMYLELWPETPSNRTLEAFCNTTAPRTSAKDVFRKVILLRLGPG
jgi:hypothetical protein